MVIYDHLLLSKNGCSYEWSVSNNLSLWEATTCEVYGPQLLIVTELVVC